MKDHPSIAGRFPLKFAVVDENTAASNEIVAAVTSKRIRVISFFLVCSAANTVTWQSATAGLTGAMSLAANGGVSATSETGLFETDAGEALNLLSGSAQQVSGAVAYIEID